MLIRDARKHRGWTQTQLAEVLGTSQSAVNRIERGHQNLTLEMLARIGEALDSEIVSLGGGPVHLRVTGGRRLSGAIDVKSSKNAGVALLCASLLNKGRTTLRKVARIEEVNRLLEVLQSIGVRTTWLNDAGDLEIVPPDRLDLDRMDAAAARRTRSIIMFLGPLLHSEVRPWSVSTPSSSTRVSGLIPSLCERRWYRSQPASTGLLSRCVTRALKSARSAIGRTTRTGRSPSPITSGRVSPSANPSMTCARLSEAASIGHDCASNSVIAPGAAATSSGICVVPLRVLGGPQI